jgi:BirA family transcriptional regulator, biotin operon repressor / biotin---[acetyl-CoA-carboxylase] ligase
MPRLKNIYYIHFDTIDSTNTWTKKNAATLDPSQLTCVTAQEQTAGRGRFYRKWISPKGQNIYATLYFCLPRTCPHIINLGQILSLSCIAVLKKKGFQPKVKWPNDILLDGKKVAGILCETVSFEDRIGIVLGIGINVNMSQELLETIDQPATSLAQLSGQTWTLEQIIEPVLKQFMKDLDILLTQGFEPFRSNYEELLAFKGESIACHDGLKTVKGICHSINSDGRLNLLLPDGHITTLSAGELKLK